MHLFRHLHFGLFHFPPQQKNHPKAQRREIARVSPQMTRNDKYPSAAAKRNSEPRRRIQCHPPTCSPQQSAATSAPNASASIASTRHAAGASITQYRRTASPSKSRAACGRADGTPPRQASSETSRSTTPRRLWAGAYSARLRKRCIQRPPWPCSAMPSKINKAK